MSNDLPPLTQSSASADATGSLVEDVVNLVEDGKIYLEAELQYQKSRASVVGVGLRKAVVLAAFGFAFVLLALLAITVGLLLALAPVLGGWAAMFAVTLLLLTAGGACVLTARGHWRGAIQHLEDARKPEPVDE